MKKLLLTTAMAFIIPLSAQAQEGPELVSYSELPSGTYSVDPTHASLVWKVSHYGLADYTARFNKFDADINYNAEDPAQSTIISEIREMKSMGYDMITVDQVEAFEADLVMYATGRRPNTASLGLEENGIKLTENGAIMVDAYSKTTVDNIYAIGDATDRINLTPVALEEGMAITRTLYGSEPVAVDYTNIPSAVFSQPPACSVGITENEARRDQDVDIYLSHFKPMFHTLSGRDENAMMKLIVARDSYKVLGVHMVGADAPEIVQGFAIALKCGATKAEFDATIGIHPTAAEEFVTMRQKVPDPSEFS